MKIDIGLAPAAVSTTYSGPDIMSKLKAGDNVRAQILENSGNELTLKFSDGTVVSAAAASAIDSAEGEFVNLTFKGIVNDKPAFEVAEKNIISQPDKAIDNIRNTLASLRLPVTDENIQIARALLDQNVQVTTDNVAKMSALLESNTGLKLDAAAFLTASKLTDDANNIQKLQTLLAGRLKISNDISELVKLTDALVKDGTGLSASSSMPSINTNSQVINKLIGKIIEQLAEKGVLNTSRDSKSEISDNSEGSAKTGQGQADKANSAVLSSSVNTRDAAIQGKVRDAVILNSNTDKSADWNTAIKSPGGAHTTEAGKVSANTANANNIDNSVKSGANTSTGIENNVNITTRTSDNRGTSSSAVPGSNIPQDNDSYSAPATKISNTSTSVNSLDLNHNNVSEKLMNLLKGEAVPGKSDLQLLNAFNKEINALINSGRLSGEELSAAKQLAGGEKLFATAVNSIKNLFIKIDDTGETINPVKLYKEMDEALQVLKSTVQQLPQGIREAAAVIVNNLESNVNFINQLNNYSSYVQLPLSIFNQNTTGELYMLKKGPKSKKLDPSNMTVLISLDSNNIGRIDTLLSIDKRNISTNFRLENSEVFPVLKEHHKQLYNSLVEKGFRLVDFTYRLMEEPINIVNFEAEAKKEFIKNSNSIDIII